MVLSDEDRAVLDFEAKWWRYPGAREQAIRDTFDMPVTRYFQRLTVLLDDPGALAYKPVVVKRLRRVRSARGDQRARRAQHG